MFALFKQYMRDKHHALKQVGDAFTLQDSIFYQTNLVRQQDDLKAQIDKHVKHSLLSALAEYQEVIWDGPPPLVTPPDTELTSINNVSDASTTASLLKMIEDLSKQVKRLTPASSSTSNINPQTGKPYCRYSWSCGCCDHWGKHHPSKKAGHQDNATFKEQQKGGST